MVERVMEEEHELDNLDEDEDEDEKTRLIDYKEEEETDFGGGESSRFRHFNTTIEDDDTKIPFLRESLNKMIFRADLKKSFTEMNDSVEVSQEKGRLSVRIYGSKTKWTPVFTLKGEINKKMSKELKKALGPSNKEIIIENDEKIKSKTQRIEELELQKMRPDISEEVKDTITNEINENKEEIVTLNEENVAIK